MRVVSGAWRGRPCASRAGSTTREVAARLASCRALVVTATEEFGIAAIEAQAAGRPVIALRAGGVRETLVEGVTGAFFDEPDPDALVGGRPRVRRSRGRPAGLRRERRALRRRALRGGDRRGRRGRAARAAASRGRGARTPARAARRSGAAPGAERVRVAVVVPCRDGRRWLPGLLASVREQTRAARPGARRRRRLRRRLRRRRARGGSGGPRAGAATSASPRRPTGGSRRRPMRTPWRS